MTFTREDILKILNALLQLGRKDSEFKDANIPLNSDDYIAILQDGINKKVSINNLLSTLGLLKKDDFINVSDRYDEYYIQLSEAITIIANNKRKKGLIITFLDLYGDWKIFQFDGELNNFSNTDYWKDLFDFKYPIVNSVLPDEEDLTSTLPNEDNNSFIKLKDKEYDATNFSGMGTKIIRKNIIEITLDDGTIKRINYLSPDVFNSENTIYVIKYDFTLTGDVTVPANCVLEFDGGSISAGNGENMNTITGNNTNIVGNLNKIFSITLSLYGTYCVKYLTPEMFISTSADDAIIINKAITEATRTNIDAVILQNKTYNISTSIIIYDGLYFGGLIDGHAFEYDYIGQPTIIMNQNLPIIDISNNIASHNRTIIGLRIKNIRLFGCGRENSNMHAIYIHDSKWFGENEIENLFIKDCRYGILVTNTEAFYTNIIKNIKMLNMVIGLYILGIKPTRTTWVNDNLFEKIAFYYMDIGGIYFDNLISNQTNTFINCSFETFGTDIIDISLYNYYKGVFAVRIDGGQNISKFLSCYFESYTAKYNNELIEGYLNNNYNSVFIVENGGGVSVENCIISSFINVFFSAYCGTIITDHNYYGVYRGEGNTGLLSVWNPLDSKEHTYIFNEEGGINNNASINKVVKNMYAYDWGVMQPYQYKDILITANIPALNATGDVGQVDVTDKCITQSPSVGASNCRPAAKTNRVGRQFFDTTLGKPIYWIVNTTYPDGTWVDATGTPV